MKIQFFSLSIFIVTTSTLPSCYAESDAQSIGNTANLTYAIYATAPHPTPVLTAKDWKKINAAVAASDQEFELRKAKDDYDRSVSPKYREAMLSAETAAKLKPSIEEP